MEKELQEHFKKKLKKFINKINQSEEKILKSNFKRNIHLYRVSIRKFRSLIEEFNQEIQLNLKHLKVLKKSFRMAGRIRDYDIAIENIMELTIKNKNYFLDTSNYMVIQTLIEELQKKRQKKYKKLLKFLKSQEYKNFKKQFNEFFNSIHFENFYYTNIKEHSICYLCLSRFYKFLSYNYWLNPNYDILEIHHFRRQIKKTRYYLEFFEEFYNQNINFFKMIESLKEMQDLTGQLVDFYMLQTLQTLIEEKLNTISGNVFKIIKEKENQVFLEFISKKNKFFNQKEEWIHTITE